MALGHALILTLTLLGVAGIVLLFRKPWAAFALLCIGALALGLLLFRAAPARTSVSGSRATVYAATDGAEVTVSSLVPDALPREDRHDKRHRGRRTGASALMAFGLLGLAYTILKGTTRRARPHQL